MLLRPLALLLILPAIWLIKTAIVALIPRGRVRDVLTKKLWLVGQLA